MMKKTKKRISAVMVGVLLVSIAVAGEAEPFDLDFSKVGWIEVRHGCWRVSFGSHSAVSLRRIGEEDSKAITLEGSFPFEEICALVAPHLKPVPGPDSKPADVLDIVFYLRDTEPSSKNFYIEDKQVIRTLMHGVRDKALPWPPYDENMVHFEELLSIHPLVLGDKPTSFKYDDEAYRIARETAADLGKMPKAVTNAESREEAIRVWSEAVQKYHEKMSKRKLPTAMQEAGRAKPSRRAADGETGIENNASDGLPGTASPYLCVGILAVLCAGAVIWFIRKRR